MKPYYITITSFFPTPFYSREFFIFEQVKVIQEQGNFQVIVFKPKTWYSKERDYEFEGVKVYRFRTYSLPSNILPGLFDSLSIWSFNHKLKTIGINIKTIEVVHSHVTGLGVFANALKKSNFKIKSVLQHHGFDVLSLENGILSRFKTHRNWVRRYGVNICNRIDLNIGVSKKTLNFLTDFKGIQPKTTYVLYNGVDKDKFYPIPSLKDTKKLTVGCIGIFRSIKDQITLLKAAKILIDQGMDNLNIKLVGKGETLESCKHFVYENGMEAFVVFIPEIPHKDLVSFYNSLDLFIMPSYYEAFGCVYAEAYACGVPFIAVKNQGISEFFEKDCRNDWLIEKGDYLQLARLIREYKDSRKPQILKYPVDISFHVNKFLNYLNSSSFNA